MSDRLLTALASLDGVVMPTLISQYKNSPVLKGILQSLDSMGDKLETAIFEVRDLFWLTTASGAQLDVIGKLFSVLRDGHTDAIYRQAIALKSRGGYSGTPEELIGFITGSLGASYAEYFPEWMAGATSAQYVVHANVVIDHTILQAASPAGVRGLQGFFLKDAKGHSIIYRAHNPVLKTRILHVHRA